MVFAASLKALFNLLLPFGRYVVFYEKGGYSGKDGQSEPPRADKSEHSKPSAQI